MSRAAGRAGVVGRMGRVGLVSLALGGCGDLVGFAGEPPALVTIEIRTTGDLAAVQLGSQAPVLQLALLWASPWRPEPLCGLPAESTAAATLIVAGCRDPLGFVPRRVAGNAPLDADGRAAIALFDLPGGDVAVGDRTSRIAYASLVVYDDRDGDGTLGLGRAGQLPGAGDGDGDAGMPPPDVVYAASFVSMTEPDTRLAFREGAFDADAAFYPRRGCEDPPRGYAYLSAGGFSLDEARAAQARGELPLEDRAACRTAMIDAPVELAFRAPAQLRALACEEPRSDSSTQYREPPAEAPDLTDRASACVALPDFGSGAARGRVQLAVSGRADDACVGLTHYVLRGCAADPLCPRPDWDLTAAPPAWWPCAIDGAR